MKTIFTEFIPEKLEKGIIYISEKYQSTSHICPKDGCSHKVVLPIHDGQFGPAWAMEKHADGTVSFDPSIGNYQECGSHYLIKHSEIIFI